MTVPDLPRVGSPHEARRGSVIPYKRAVEEDVDGHYVHRDEAQDGGEEGGRRARVRHLEGRQDEGRGEVARLEQVGGQQCEAQRHHEHQRDERRAWGREAREHPPRAAGDKEQLMA